jgi:hypothetical protein
VIVLFKCALIAVAIKASWDNLVQTAFDHNCD